MLRTLAVLIVATIGTLAAFTGPLNALPYYLWVAHFRPEAWVWSDFVQTLNLSLIAGVLTLGAAIFGRVKWRFDFATVLILLFGAHNLLSTAMSPHFDDVWGPFFNFAKSLVIVYLI